MLSACIALIASLERFSRLYSWAGVDPGGTARAPGDLRKAPAEERDGRGTRAVRQPQRPAADPVEGPTTQGSRGLSGSRGCGLNYVVRSAPPTVQGGVQYSSNLKTHLRHVANAFATPLRHLGCIELRPRAAGRAGLHAVDEARGPDEAGELRGPEGQ